MGLVCTNCILAALTKPSELLDPKIFDNPEF